MIHVLLPQLFDQIYTVFKSKAWLIPVDIILYLISSFLTGFKGNLFPKEHFRLPVETRSLVVLWDYSNKPVKERSSRVLTQTSVASFLSSCLSKPAFLHLAVLDYKSHAP